jgi:hypothetical protein
VCSNVIRFAEEKVGPLRSSEQLLRQMICPTGRARCPYVGRMHPP